MEFLLIRISDAGVKTGEPNEGSLARERTQNPAAVPARLAVGKNRLLSV
jgi:hypothetical protein